jgi:hypothetical protein
MRIFGCRARPARPGEAASTKIRPPILFIFLILFLFLFREI